MSQLQMDHEQHHHHHHQDQPFDDHSSNWHDNGAYNPSQHHQSPVQDFNAMPFNNSYTPLPMETIYNTGMHPPRTTHPQLQPLIMPQQWPSMMTSQSSYVPPIFQSAHVPITPASATPVSATSTTSRTSSTPRKTLTDQDRRRMCLYHEEHPTVKQTEIGAMFGVERSTVSKVLRQKEKYLYQDDGSRSPIKRVKGKFPDIERALANWATKQQRQGLPLSDEIIQTKAKFFANSVGNSESHLKANSTSWLEKFKQKNNLLGSKSRKGSIAEESEGASNPPSNSHTPGGLSPVTPSGVSSPIPAKKSAENLRLKTDSPDTFDFSHRRPFHSVSNTSLSSVFTDTAPSSFSAGPTSPTSLSSPFFTPDSASNPNNPFMGNQQARGQPGSGNFQRPRSQTFPLLIGVEPYMSPPGSSEALTPKYSTALDSPLNELRPSLPNIDDAMQEASPTQASMQPPPVPPLTIPAQQSDASQAPSSGIESASPVTPSQEEAARALELVMNFFQQHPQGFVEPQEYATIGKLMERLKIKRSSENLPSMMMSQKTEFSLIGKAE